MGDKRKLTREQHPRDADHCITLNFSIHGISLIQQESSQIFAAIDCTKSPMTAETVIIPKLAVIFSCSDLGNIAKAYSMSYRILALISAALINTSLLILGCVLITECVFP